LLYVGSRFGLSRSAEKLFARNAGWGASCLFAQALQLSGVKLIALMHHTKGFASQSCMQPR